MEVRILAYYCVLLPTINAEKRKRFLLGHLSHIEEMNRRGKIFVSGSFRDGAGDLIIYEAESIEQVKLFVLQDPLVYMHASDYEIHEWNMAVVKTPYVANEVMEGTHE